MIMTNNEKLNEQLRDISDLYADMFTKEEIEGIEKDFDAMLDKMIKDENNHRNNKI